MPTTALLTDQSAVQGGIIEALISMDELKSGPNMVQGPVIGHKFDISISIKFSI